MGVLLERAVQRGQGPRVLDLFAGAGGFSLGLHWAGYHTAVAIDHKPTAIETLSVNFSHHGTKVLERDLSSFTPQDLSKFFPKTNSHDLFDLVVGGPPCQGWSMVGRGKIRTLSESDGRHCTKTDPRNELYKRFLSFVKFFQPKVAVMENVAGMLSHSGLNVAENVALCMENSGYNVSWTKINASDFGVPQHRERLFFVGVRKDLKRNFVFPIPVTERGRRAFPLVTVEDAINDLPIIRHGNKDWIQLYKKQESLTKFAKRMRLGADQSKIFDHVCRTHNDQDLEAFKLMKQGGWYRDLPKRLKRYRDDIFEDKYKKLKWNKPSGCITAHLSKDCYTHIHPSQSRTISVREAARLQSFPDSFYFAGTMGSKFELIGNAVAPFVAEMIGNEIRIQILSKTLSKKDKAHLFAVRPVFLSNRRVIEHLRKRIAKVSTV